MFIDVIGVGPGNPDYILPIGLQRISEADIVIGGKRNLNDLAISNKEVFVIGNNLCEITKIIEENYEKKKIAVLVSGDPGFHSMLSYLKRSTKGIDFRVTPGISSFTYFFSSIAMTWDDAILSSVHGKNIDYITLIQRNKKIGFLTDSKITPKVIAKEMKEKGITHKKFYIGERLSYEDEKITKLNIEEVISYEADTLCVMVIADEGI